MILLYHIFRYLFLFGVRVASFRNTKANLWLAGRKDWKEKLASQWKNNNSDKVVWMHCASLGEFEQGQPILEAIRSSSPTTKILLTFFSPSGYEAKKNYDGADHVMYLPFDGPDNAHCFIDLINPSLAIFVKYEFWYFYLTELKERNIPTILASGLFRKSQPFFQFWGSLHRQMLQSFSFFFLQDDNSLQLLKKIHLDKNASVSGDTRFDRVNKIAQNNTPIEFAENFCTQKTLVAGSTWPEDELLLKDWKQLQPNWKLILVPHEISVAHIQNLKRLFADAVCLSEISKENNGIQSNVLIIDAMGLLSRLYQYASLCYIGGGLKRSGHHNILEAAVYGKAITTGPYIHKFSESVALNLAGGSFIVTNGKELFDVSSQELKWENAGRIASGYVQSNLGATNKIINWIEQHAFLKK